MLLWLPVTLLLMTFDKVYTIMSNSNAHKHKSNCFSCASFAYLPLWNQLMHHYFPPKNFTDRCWQPDAGIGTVPCTSACFTLVERIDQQDFFSEQRGVIRGCVDRLLLFGLDDDVRNVLSAYTSQHLCRETNRKILRLYPLSADSDVVTLCSCSGDQCNDQDMLLALNSSDNSHKLVHLILLLIMINRLLHP
ncbi:hypothetical protein KIN20_001881 [Parelaphostrongylus tenuis]|uniref:Uncharacterized protein n=1 Tax=Parelaphostrongylus tenuis TaxID=148309 RepID=A0AAD5QHD6_PARTN|nr:hypothetical protein KIN20_001881 [Parelaphostrongylus tenuis]